MHCSMPISVVAVACGLLAGATTAQAGNESWVSGSGSDVGSCPITAPCRTFAYAHNQTTAQGAINVLSSGNFGPVTITKAISIVADGVEAVINTGNNGGAIIVSAPATAVVSLRGLTIDMRGTSNSGIVFDAGGALHMSNSVIRKVSTGFFFAPSATAELYVADCVIADSASTGIWIDLQGSAGAKVVLERVRVENAAINGIWFQGDNTTGAIIGTVRESVVTGNASHGILVSEAGGGTSRIMVDRSVVANNFVGLRATGAGATARMGDSTVSGNSGGGISPVSGGVIDSYGTNQVNGNFIDGTPTNTITMK